MRLQVTLTGARSDDVMVVAQTASAGVFLPWKLSGVSYRAVSRVNHIIILIRDVEI